MFVLANFQLLDNLFLSFMHFWEINMFPNDTLYIYLQLLYINVLLKIFLSKSNLYIFQHGILVEFKDVTFTSGPPDVLDVFEVATSQGYLVIKFHFILYSTIIK